MPIRRFTERGSPSREDAPELEVVAEGARPDVLEAFRGQEHGRRRQRDHADALAVEPADGELVLEGELEALTAEIVEPVELGGAPKETLGGPAGDVPDLAPEHEPAALG